MRDAFLGRLLELARQDERIMLLTGDLGFRVLDGFREELPRQFLNVGIAEQNMTGIATGLALEGRIVFNYSIGNFVSLRCYEQLRNDACYHEANVKAVCIGAGFSYGPLGMSHHATEDIAVMRALPNMTIMSPGDLWEAAEATEALVRTPGPAYLRLDRGGPKSTQRPGERFEPGKARIVVDGSDISIVSTGGVLEEVLKAAASLERDGIQCRIINFHTIRPFDREAVAKAARETGGIVTVEEHTVAGGLGGLVAEELLELGEVPKTFYRMGLRGGFSSIVGSQPYLRKRYEFDAGAIEAKVKELIASPRRRAKGGKL